jgi:hypothetical protein
MQAEAAGRMRGINTQDKYSNCVGENLAYTATSSSTQLAAAEGREQNQQQ